MGGIGLPGGWRLLTLGEVARWGSGGTPKRTNPNYFGGPIPWVVIGDLKGGVVVDTATRITEEGLRASSAKWIPKGAVLLAMYGSIGKLGIAGGRITTNQAIAHAVVDERVVASRYLFWYLKSLRRDLVAAGKGGTQRNISQTVIKALPIPVPPLDEQGMIVEIIEQQLTRIEEAVRLLEGVQTRLRRHRGAVMTRAFQGHPTRSLVEICVKIADCEHRTPRYGTGEIPALRPRDVVGGIVDLSNAGGVSEAEYVRQTRRHVPVLGDVAYSRELSYGWAAELPDTRVCLGQGMVVLRPKDDVLASWIVHYLNSPHGREQSKRAASGSAHPHINLAKIRDYRLPAPQLSTQEAILSEISAQVSMVDRLEADLIDARAKASQLAQTVLREAFHGRLSTNGSHTDPTRGAWTPLDMPWS